MSNFLKRLFKDDTQGITKTDENDVINLVAKEIITENCDSKRNSSVDTNRLPDIFSNAKAEAFKGFSSYLAYSESCTGMVRQNNQDSIFAGEFKYNIANKPVNAGMAIVADGMGGLSMGEVASLNAVTSVTTYMCARLSEYIQDSLVKGFPHSQVVLGHISEAVKNANRIIRDKSVTAGESIGTTLTCVFILGNKAYFGHVGDSRAYIIDTEDKSIEKITKDHSLVGRLIEMGHITDKEAKSHPRRNEIYKMLGLRDQIEVDTYYRVINKSSVILLMSDGLWEFADDDEMLRHVMVEDDIYKSGRALVNLANTNGGHDNISLIIVKPVE